FSGVDVAGPIVQTILVRRISM
ncbi:MAG: hypothetical protein RLZZ29_1710, partial [Cyanobacteriota bacterium]